MRVLRLEVSVYNVYITNQFQTPFGQRGGVKSVEVTVEYSMEENSEEFCPNYVKEFGLCAINLNMIRGVLRAPSVFTRP